MIKFFPKLQPLVAAICWAKNLVILARFKDPLLPKLDSQKYRLTPAGKTLAVAITLKK
jgi:hypothetical protein